MLVRYEKSKKVCQEKVSTITKVSSINVRKK